LTGVAFYPPSSDLRREYFQKLAAGFLEEEVRCRHSKPLGRILLCSTPQLAFRRNAEEILGDDLLERISGVRNTVNGVEGRLGDRKTGFACCARASALA